MKKKKEELQDALQSLERCCPGSTSGLNKQVASSELCDALFNLDRARSREQQLREESDILKEELLTANESLREAHDDLELRVEQRTAELRASNLSLQNEIIERKRAEEEKVLLLREIHHRVKNNMQVISSLLSLQASQIADKQYADKFDDSRNRIRSMALVHEKLYQSEDMANIDFNDYIRTLANSLISFYSTKAGSVHLKINVEDVLLGIDTAIPCGLVINELISNCLKHAFPENRKGEITVSFSKSSVEGVPEYDLVVKDNGIGMPEGLDIWKTESLGLQLIMTLIENQLMGTVDIDRTNGTEFHIHFKEISYEKRI